MIVNKAIYAVSVMNRNYVVVNKILVNLVIVILRMVSPFVNHVIVVMN